MNDIVTNAVGIAINAINIMNLSDSFRYCLFLIFYSYSVCLNFRSYANAQGQNLKKLNRIVKNIDGQALACLYFVQNDTKLVCRMTHIEDILGVSLSLMEDILGVSLSLFRR